MGIREIGFAGDKLIIHESDDVYDPVTGRALTRSWIWDSAFVLIQWLSTQQEFDFHNKTVLELGAGTGLPGLAVARLGAGKVVLTDIEQLVPGLKKNVEANGLEDRVQVSRLVWGSEELPSEVVKLGEVDVVLMSDVFFDAAEMAALASTLKRVCGKNTRAWAASTVRPSMSECFSELANEGFEIVDLSSQLTACGDSSDSVAVFQLLPSWEELVITCQGFS